MATPRSPRQEKYLHTLPDADVHVDVVVQAGRRAARRVVTGLAADADAEARSPQEVRAGRAG